MKNNEIEKKLLNLTLPVVESLGLEIYHLEYVKEGAKNIFRIYIEGETNVSLDDCVKVSRAVSDMLDVEDPIVEEYNLEVSSPGIFRTLFTDKHLSRYVGNDVKVTMNTVFSGKRKFEGLLVGADSENLTVKENNEEIIIPRNKISVVNLNPVL